MLRQFGLAIQFREKVRFNEVTRVIFLFGNLNYQLQLKIGIFI